MFLKSSASLLGCHSLFLLSAKDLVHQIAQLKRGFISSGQSFILISCVTKIYHVLSIKGNSEALSCSITSCGMLLNFLFANGHCVSIAHFFAIFIHPAHFHGLLLNGMGNFHVLLKKETID